MSLSVMAQVASAATNLLFVVVIAIGYFMIRLYRQMVAVYDRMLGFMESESVSLGRPLVVVYEDPQTLPNINLVVQNVGSGPARDISFEFSAPIESSDGFVLTDLAVFKEGMTSLAPEAKLTCYWDELANLLSRIEEGKTPATLRPPRATRTSPAPPMRPPGTSSPTSMRASETSTTRASTSSWRRWRESRKA